MTVDNDRMIEVKDCVDSCSLNVFTRRRLLSNESKIENSLAAGRHGSAVSSLDERFRTLVIFVPQVCTGGRRHSLSDNWI